MDHTDLIDTAVSVLDPHTVGDRLLADVGAALETHDGGVFVGVCLDLGSGIGFCAEHAAIGAMVTARRHRIARIVAVWRDPDTTLIHVLPPCGRCRELIRQIDATNLDTRVVLGRRHDEPLRDLLPHHEWPQPLEA